VKFSHYLISSFVATHLHHGEILHGHNFKCKAVFQLKNEQLNKKHFYKIMEKLNYIHLNTLPFFKKNTPSTENIALFIFQYLKQYNCNVFSVEVFETDNASGGIKQC
jgi:6-pyruvoyl-tetrahydropterin synthase